MNFGSLFSGIGGIDLGLERAGMQCAWQVEIDPFCRSVLERHWPRTQRFEDVRQVNEGNLQKVDLIAGGFPCQDVSSAGWGVGIEGERSGLWSEFSRIISGLRPRYVLVENVTGLLGRGLGRVLSDLAKAGYDAEWSCISAAALGAPHIRDRVWILAYPGQEHGGTARRPDQGLGRCDVFPEGGDGKTSERCEHRELAPLVPGVHSGVASDWWRHQSCVDRTANGLPRQLDRSCALGNAVVPQVVEWIGRRIMNATSADSGRKV